MNNFCVNCGNKLGKDDKYCTNCGTRIDKSGNPSVPDAMEKRRAKRELKRVIGGKFIYHKSFGNKLYYNGLDLSVVGRAIRDQLEREIESGQIRSEDIESRVDQLIAEHKIKHEEEMVRIAKEAEEEQKIKKAAEERLKESREKKARIAKANQMNRRVQANERKRGGYCGWGCQHCYEEFLDSAGGIVGDFDEGGYVEYYCHLGHPIAFGRYCEYYE